jgi:molybdate/tungstate transport system permease protein
VSRSPGRTVVLAVLTLLASVVMLALVLPIGTLLTGAGVGGMLGALRDADVLRALGLTLLLAAIATLLAVLGGLPIAYLLARVPFRGRTLLEVLLELPMVVPHPVIGMAILLAAGRNSAIGATLAAVGLRIVNSPAGVVVAMLVVSAPIFIFGAREAIARVDPRYENVARTLGDDRWQAVQRVTLPMARNGILSAATAMWARATSEFGAIVLVAYHPRVASVLAYDRYVTYGLRAVLPVAAVLIVTALGILLLVRVTRRPEPGA